MRLIIIFLSGCLLLQGSLVAQSSPPPGDGGIAEQSGDVSSAGKGGNVPGKEKVAHPCCPGLESVIQSFRKACKWVTNQFEKSPPDWAFWSFFDTGLKAFGTVLGAVLAAFLGARWAARYAYRKWLEEHLTDKWYEIIQLGIENPQFMDESKTQNYKTAFKDLDAVKYDLFARTCVAFVDHMVNEHAKDITPPDGIFCGSGRLLAGRHRAWIQDNTDAYNRKFQKWFFKLLKSMPIPDDSKKPTEDSSDSPIEDHQAP